LGYSSAAIGAWLENFVHQSGVWCLDLFWRRVVTVGKEAKIGENAVDKANLSECYAVDEVGNRVNILVNVNAKIICNRTLIFKHKVGAEAGKKGIDHDREKKKNATVIGVQSNDAIIAKEQARITCGLMKTTCKKPLDKVPVPIVCGLLTTI